jgi:hypothetical protein
VPADGKAVLASLDDEAVKALVLARVAVLGARV